jgi:small subunit ribosomal protein S20
LATHASALKRARQSEKRRKRNAAIKSQLKTFSKKVLRGIEAKDPKVIDDFRKAASAIQKASSKKVIHKKTAARWISRLAKKVNTFRPSAPAPQGTASS